MTSSHFTPLRNTLPVLSALLIGQCILSSGATAAPVHRPVHASIKSVALSTSDITHAYGGSFKAFINGVISNKDFASAEKTAGTSSALSITATGRVTGYESVWLRNGKTGYLSVVNYVNEYKSSTFPQALLGQIRRYKSAGKGATFHLSSISGAGDEAWLLTFHSHGTTGQGIIFRRDRYLVELMASSQHGTVSMTIISKLTAIEDQRIQSAG